MILTKTQLPKLKCSLCDEYLSCGPVFIKIKNGEAICGRCKKPENEPVIQNKQYEELAEHQSFPCRYSRYGCENLIKFSKNKQNPHEENCYYMPRLCPIGELEQCCWIGSWKQLLQHCKDKHSEKVLQNSSIFLQDLTTPNLAYYLLEALNLVFIIRAKICSGKLLHTISMIGDIKTEEIVNYCVIIRRTGGQVIKCGSVVPISNLNNEDTTSICLDIKSLIEILGDPVGIEFSTAVKFSKKRKLANSQ